VRAQVLIDGKPAGETKAGEAFTASAEPGRHRISVRADNHVSLDPAPEFRTGVETLLAWRELAQGVGTVQLAVQGGMTVTYSSGDAAPKNAAPGSLTLPVGDYVFRAASPGAPDQTQPVQVKLGQAVAVNFAPPRTGGAATTTSSNTGPSGGEAKGGAKQAPTLFRDDDWKPDAGYMKLEGGKASAVPGSLGVITFQVRRRGNVFGGRPNWFYTIGADVVRFELGNDKLTWWVAKAGKERKVDDMPMPKEVEDVRVEISAATITHMIGGKGASVDAAAVGTASFAGGQFRFRGPIWVKDLARVR